MLLACLLKSAGEREDFIFDGPEIRPDAGQTLSADAVAVVSFIPVAEGDGDLSQCGAVFISQWFSDGLDVDPGGNGERKTGIAEDGPHRRQPGIFARFDAVKDSCGNRGRAADRIFGSDSRRQGSGRTIDSAGMGSTCFLRKIARQMANEIIDGDAFVFLQVESGTGLGIAFCRIDLAQLFRCGISREIVGGGREVGTDEIAVRRDRRVVGIEHREAGGTGFKQGRASLGIDDAEVGIGASTGLIGFFEQLFEIRDGAAGLQRAFDECAVVEPGLFAGLTEVGAEGVFDTEAGLVHAHPGRPATAGIDDGNRPQRTFRKQCNFIVPGRGIAVFPEQRSAVDGCFATDDGGGAGISRGINRCDDREQQRAEAKEPSIIHRHAWRILFWRNSISRYSFRGCLSGSVIVISRQEPLKPFKTGSRKLHQIFILCERSVCRGNKKSPIQGGWSNKIYNWRGICFMLSGGELRVYSLRFTVYSERGSGEKRIGTGVVRGRLIIPFCQVNRFN